MYIVFYNSAFKRTLCGSAWLNAFSNLGTSTARYGCCSPGSYMLDPELNPFVEANACTKCPTGKYGHPLANDDSACIDCSTGKYNDQVGQTSESTACKVCPVGYFAEYAGSSSCIKCAPGYYNADAGIAAANHVGCDKCMFRFCDYDSFFFL